MRANAWKSSSSSYSAAREAIFLSLSSISPEISSSPSSPAGSSPPSSSKPGVFPYQGLLSIVTEGIAIVEVDATSTAFAVDAPVYASDSGEAIASGGSGTNFILGRALDTSAGTTAGQYIRVKLGSEGAS